METIRGSARYNMIHQQIRPFAVSSPDVVSVLESVDREDFVPISLQSQAFFDTVIPLECDQCMLEPKTEAKILQALDIRATDKILEIGTGSGYLTACLASLGRRVVSIEIHEQLSEQAQTKLDAANIQNVTLKTADALDTWDSEDKYDVIVFTGAVNLLDDDWKKRLNVGGRLLVFVGITLSEVCLITRTTSETYEYTSLFELYAPALVEIDAEPEFVF